MVSNLSEYSKIPIIDSHVHLIYPDLLKYNWEVPHPRLNQLRTEERYLAENKNLNIKGYLFMEVDAIDFEKETAIIRDLMKAEGSKMLGIIPLVPMHYSFEEMVEFLDRINSKEIVGVRYRIQTSEKVPEGQAPTYLSEDFYKKLAHISKIGLPFHLAIHQVQFPYALKLVEENPNTLFLLDHLGKPFIDGEDFDFWSNNLKEMSKFKNVICKISPGFNFPDNFFELSKRYIDYAIEVFDNDKLVVGSDNGAGTINVSFEDWMKMVFEVFEERKLSQSDAENILFKNMEKIYKLS